MPQELFDRIVEKYSACSSYQDSGRIEGKLFAGDWSEDLNALQFSSCFIRPRIFSFKYEPGSKDTWLPFSLVSDGESFRRIQYSDGKVQNAEFIPNIETSFADFKGSTFNHFFVVAQLLMPPLRESASRSINDLVDLEFAMNEDSGVRNLELLQGRLGALEYRFTVDIEELELVSLEIRGTADAEIQTILEKNLEAAKIANHPGFVNFQLPKELVSVITCIYFDKRVFNDNLTIESIIET